MNGTSKPEGSRRIPRRSLLVLQLMLLGVSIAFVAAFAAAQYGLIRSFVRFLCITCLGLSD